MKPLHTFLLLIFILIFAALGVAVRNIDLVDASVRLASISKEGTDYKSRDIGFSEFEQDILGEAEGIKLLYLWRGQRYALSVIDGSRNRHAIHDPRYCFRGAGWEIVDESEVPFLGGEAIRMTLEDDEVRCEALFFYSTGDLIFSNPTEYWLRATLRRWTIGRSSPEPVLIMVQSLDSGASISEAMNQFLPLLNLP